MNARASSRLLPFHLVYHEGYDLNFGAHVFPSHKFRIVRERLLASGEAAEADFVEPLPAPDNDLTAVHDVDWVNRIKNGTLSFHDIRLLEVPYSKQMANAYLLAAGGTTKAAECAIKDGIGFNVGGGFHHAFPGHGEGFCAINDIAVAASSLLRRGLIQKALVVDCDLHQGNGTAVIFATATNVYTLSIHQFHNYPAEKPPSTVDIHLPDGTGDEDYLRRLRQPLHEAISGFRPDLLLYVAGADPYQQDQLGGLDLTLEGLKQRDRLVFESALRHGVPVAVTLAGGYAVDFEDTITIHRNTAIVARECLSEIGWNTVQPSER